ncbi:centromere protein I [Microcaecilia unicolor]|uniref:Centromere protein I n=1 Tax=Microcaecilia unicolor TaxID=1415580 RepID=A0A6P7YLI9_9AMPH|nr:centromere protein I [Microcaecilia unicolor]XP_030065873.1 centromere protein I [Microcaecilia unicolor]XP_030065874.1 centromere protein I [Microcaecilia unicolor]
MEKQKLHRSSRRPAKPEQQPGYGQGVLSALHGHGKERGDITEKINIQKTHQDKCHSADDQAEVNEHELLEQGLQYFEKVEGHVQLKGNGTLLKHLNTVESVGTQKGLPPEGIDILLSCALSGKFVDTVNSRLLKCLIPSSVVSEDAVVKAVSWFCVDQCTASTQVLFVRWLITMFDLVDHKEKLRALYGCFFCSLQDERLCPYICHLLYLLTKKENVKPFRVRKLLDLQIRVGMQPHLQGLLSLYKVYCPELVSLTLPTRVKTFFKNSESLWKAEIMAVRRRNFGSPSVGLQMGFGIKQLPSQSKKRKWNSHMNLPVSSSGLVSHEDVSSFHHLHQDEAFPVELLQTFTQLVQNIHRLQFPAQMGSVLKSPLLLHYINCIKDDSVFLRLNYWMAQVLHEECAWYTGNQHNETEVRTFLDTIANAQQFLQEGFSNCEEFLYKSIPHWNGCYRSQILQLLSWIPLTSFSEMEQLLYEPLGQIFFTSSLYFKCGVIESLKEMLQNWLSWHAFYAVQVNIQDSPMNNTLSGLVNTVCDLIHFVGRISTIALHITNSSLLLHFILDFYEIVCDMYVKYAMPLVVLPPSGVFYPALLSLESVNLNHLCYIMYRYRKNLVAAKENEWNKKCTMWLNINSQTIQEYNQYVLDMVGCLWTSQAFQKDRHPQGIFMDAEMLARTGVENYRNSFNIVRHPALMGHAILFLQQGFGEDKTVNLDLIKGKLWNWYVEYLYKKGMRGLKVFVESSISRISCSSQSHSNTAESCTSVAQK